jgi:hypothetical protein
MGSHRLKKAIAGKACPLTIIFPVEELYRKAKI